MNIVPPLLERDKESALDELHLMRYKLICLYHRLVPFLDPEKWEQLGEHLDAAQGWVTKFEELVE
jgi:hypothetical protein